MGYITTSVDGSGDITVTCPDDAITFDISAENAVLMESGPSRVHVKDDNGDWYIYETMMFHYGTSANGMSGNDNSAHTITGDWDWYALNSTNETNQAAITTSLQDQELTINTGSAVTDLNIPDSVGSSGFAYDSALHIEPANDEVKLTFDRTRYNQPVVIHEEGFRTGTAASPTEHLVGYWKMDDDAASTVIAAEVGSNGSLEGGADTEDISTDGVRGKALQLDGTDDHIDLSDAIDDLDDMSKFTIIIIAKPLFDYDANGDHYLFYIGSSGNNRIHINYTLAQWQIKYVMNTESTQIQVGETFTSNGNLQKFHTFMLSFDADSSIVIMSFDGEIIYSGETNDWGVNPNALSMGYSNAAYNHGAYTIDEVKLFDGCILPYGGGPFLDAGNDYANPHESVTAFSENGSSWDIGTGVIGDIDNSAGQLSFWVDPPSALSADETLVSFGTNFHVKWDDSDDDIELTYGSGTTIRTTTSLTAGMDGKHFVKVGWTASDQITLEVDGVAETPVSASTAPTLAGSITWSSSVGMTRKCITDNTNTPDQWSAMGAPRLLPNLEVTE